MSTVKQYWALTAAHCFDAYPNAGTTALLVGDHNLQSGTDTKWARVYPVASYYKHQNYIADGNINDVALVRTGDYIRYK